MSTILAFAIVLLTLGLLIAAFFISLMLRPCVLHLFIGYRSNSLQMRMELTFGRKSLFSASAYTEGEQWHTCVQAGSRPARKQSWTPFAYRFWYRMLRRLWHLWKHPERSAWIDISWRLIRDVWEQMKLLQAVTTFRMGFSTYPQTGYLAAAAYPLNFTLFRALGAWRLHLIPEFSAKGLSFENHLRFSFRGYQLLKPGYRFLKSPVVRGVLRSHLSKKIRRFRWHFGL